MDDFLEDNAVDDVVDLIIAQQEEGTNDIPSLNDLTLSDQTLDCTIESGLTQAPNSEPTTIALKGLSLMEYELVCLDQPETVCQCDFEGLDPDFLALIEERHAEYGAESITDD